MKYGHRRTIWIIAPLIILLLLSFYSFEVGSDKNPPTGKVLDNPAKYENKHLQMRGILKDCKFEGEVLNLTLERYDRIYKVRYYLHSKEEFESIERGDVFDLLGVCRLSSKGYVEATELKRRPAGRHYKLFLFSIFGVALILGMIIWDKETFNQVVPIG